MIWIAVSLTSILVFVLCSIWFGQRYLVFMPSKDVLATPAMVGLSYESVEIETADGVTVRGWFVPTENPRGSVVYCHGNGGNIGGRVPHVEAMHELGLNVLIFDYRGYGDSDGKPSEQGTYADAEAAYDFLAARPEVDPERIVIWGRSLGGAVALYLATKRESKGLVLESTFTSLSDVGKSLYPFLPVKAVLRFDYPSAERIVTLDDTLPILIAHAEEDSIVPYSHGQRLYDLAPDNKRFVELRGDHNAAHLLQRQWRSDVEQFVDDALGDARRDSAAAPL